MSFPRLYAAASLKLGGGLGLHVILVVGFPRLYAAASLKLLRAARGRGRSVERFPRLYAAASLKQDECGGHAVGEAAVFRGFMPRPH